jgi:hypothetical protein
MDLTRIEKDSIGRFRKPGKLTKILGAFGFKTTLDLISLGEPHRVILPPVEDKYVGRIVNWEAKTYFDDLELPENSPFLNEGVFYHADVTKSPIGSEEHERGVDYQANIQLYRKTG